MKVAYLDPSQEPAVGIFCLMAKNMPLNNVTPNENPLLVVDAIWTWAISCLHDEMYMVLVLFQTGGHWGGLLCTCG